jgi:large subunit ribosomal protein L29
VKADEIRALGDEELTKQLEEARRELFNLRFRLETRQLVNHREIYRVKRNIARMITIVRERQLAEAQMAGGNTMKGQVPFAAGTGRVGEVS